jgi:hypothetical protein
MLHKSRIQELFDRADRRNHFPPHERSESTGELAVMMSVLVGKDTLIVQFRMSPIITLGTVARRQKKHPKESISLIQNCLLIQPLYQVEQSPELFYTVEASALQTDAVIQPRRTPPRFRCFPDAFLRIRTVKE